MKSQLTDFASRIWATNFCEYATLPRTVFSTISLLDFPITCYKSLSTNIANKCYRFTYRPVGFYSKNMILMNTLVALWAKGNKIIGTMVRGISCVYSTISLVNVVDMRSFRRPTFYTPIVVPFKNFIANIIRKFRFNILDRLSQKITLPKPKTGWVSKLCLSHFFSCRFAYHLSLLCIMHNIIMVG